MGFFQLLTKFFICFILYTEKKIALHIVSVKRLFAKNCYKAK
jgi:hypothetical protein